MPLGRSTISIVHATTGERLEKLWAAIDAVGKDMPQLRQAASQVPQQRDRAMTILNIGGMNMHGEQEPVAVGDDMTLAPRRRACPSCWGSSHEGQMADREDAGLHVRLPRHGRARLHSL